MIFGPWKSLLCLHPFHVDAKCPIDFVWLRCRVWARESARHRFQLEKERKENWWAACVLEVVLTVKVLCAAHIKSLQRKDVAACCYRSSASIEHELVINKLMKLCATLLLHCNGDGSLSSRRVVTLQWTHFRISIHSNYGSRVRVGTFGRPDFHLSEKSRCWIGRRYCHSYLKTHA